MGDQGFRIRQQFGAPFGIGDRVAIGHNCVIGDGQAFFGFCSMPASQSRSGSLVGPVISPRPS
jgi:hypothetical protein